MALIIGAVLALMAGVISTVAGLDRDRALYPVVTIVVGTYYVLFAAMGASHGTLALEVLGAACFAVAAVVGFRSSLWVVVAALAGHGIFDFVHGHVIDNPGVPAWWPEFCGAYDVMAALYLAWLIRSSRIGPKAAHRLALRSLFKTRSDGASPLPFAPVCVRPPCLRCNHCIQ